MHDLLYKAWADRGLVYNAKGKTLNIWPCVRYVRLSKAKDNHKREAYSLVREDVTQGL
jgi:hypothetical protein